MDWILMAVGILGFHLAGKKIWWAWYVNIANQVLWLVYAITTGQMGFLVGTFFYLAVFSKNAYVWTTEYLVDRREAREYISKHRPVGTVESVVEDERGLQVTGVFEPPRDPDLQLLLDGMAMERAKLPYITGATLDERKHELGHLYQPGEDRQDGREGYCPSVHPQWADFRCTRMPGHSTNLKHGYAGVFWD